jgi:hypothetical protein
MINNIIQIIINGLFEMQNLKKIQKQIKNQQAC